TNNIACESVEVLSFSAPRPPRNPNAHLSGWNLENVTLTWDLSLDDGVGAMNVVGYDIFRSEVYDSNGIGYQLLQSVCNGSSAYVDSGAGESNPSNYFYFVCAVNSAGNQSCSLDQAAKFTRPLFQGPSLVSLPLVQSNESIEYVLQTVKYDRAWYYDSFSQEWKWYMTSKAYRRGLWNLNHSMGLWVNVTVDSNLTVAGVVPANTRIQLYSGWNLVGFPSFNSNYSVSDLNAEVGSTRLEGFDFLPPHYLRVLGVVEVLQAGYGYWVRVETDLTWTIEVE
ncbi:MAG: hypothetical protein KAW09_08815, partial [Thermoplasmata archaeon]|nr:hypothetical protein [Thermoplasmata archaeon]